MELVLEARAPVVLGVQSLHRVQEGVREVALGKGDALDLLEGAGLLLSLGTRILEGLILGLNTGDLSLDFLLPTVMFIVNSLVGLVLVVTDLV